MSKTKAPKGTFRTEIPFELHNGLIVIKAKLNGSEKEYEFILDSGAPASVIFKEAMEESKAASVMSYKVSDSQGNSMQSDYVLLDVILGNSEFKDVFATYTAEPGVLLPCIAHDGLIGANLMQTANWQIDFENKKIVISDRKKSSLPDLKDYQKVSFTKRAPFSSMRWLTVLPGMAVDIKVNGKLYKDIWVDLGSSGALSLPKNPVTDTLLKNEPKQTLLGYSTFGLFGAKMDTAYYYKSSEMILDGVQFNTHTITLEKQRRSLLGTEILSDYTLYIDFRKKDMYLKPVVPNKTSDDKKLGFSLLYTSETSKCYIASILQDSPADQSGLQLNDVLTEINGQPLPAFKDFCEFREWSRKIHHADAVTMKIEREDKLIKIDAALVPWK